MRQPSGGHRRVRRARDTSRRGESRLRSSWRTWLRRGASRSVPRPSGPACGERHRTAAAPAARPATPVEGAEITIALGSRADQPRPAPRRRRRRAGDQRQHLRDAAHPHARRRAVPGLATELPTQVDDTTWEFTLREGVTFHNGEPFNADSVVATINRMIGLIERGDDRQRSASTPRSPAPTAVDEHTVQITTDGPDGVLPARMYWLKHDPGRAPRRRRTCPTSRSAPARTRSTAANQGVDIDDRRQRGLLGRRADGRQGHLRVLRRRRARASPA